MALVLSEKNEKQKAQQFPGVDKQQSSSLKGWPWSEDKGL